VEAARWVARARSNLLLATNGERPGVFLEELCFNAHQAVEKAIKAVFVANGVPHPRIHDLAELLRLLQSRNLPTPPGGNAVTHLNRWAVEERYPGTSPPATREQFAEALRLATSVVEWAEAQVGAKRG
jgi:HEPN domain-containing protein